MQRIATLFCILLLALPELLAQPAYISTAEQPFDYEIQLNKENIFCHLTTRECFNGPYGTIGLNTDTEIKKTTNGWQITIKSSSWSHEITREYLKGLVWHPTFGRAWVTFGEKDTTFHRSVALDLYNDAYILEQQNPASNGIGLLPTTSCFNINPNFVVVKGNAGEYLIRVNWHFVVAICKRQSENQRGRIILSAASVADHQLTEVENVFVNGKFAEFTHYPNSKVSQAVIKYGKQQITIQVATCKVMQTIFGASGSPSEELFYAARSGWVAEKTGFASLRKISQQSPKSGPPHDYFFYCLAERGLYVNQKHKRIAGGINLQSPQGTLRVTVSPPKSSGRTNFNPPPPHHHHQQPPHGHVGGKLSDYLHEGEGHRPYAVKN